MTDLRFQPGSIEPLRIDELRPYARNPRTHSDDQVAKLAASLVEFGWTMPILVNDELEVIAGHGRILAARRLGLDAVPVIRLAHLSPEQVRAYRIADNKLALDAGWDEELLAAEFHELNGAGYDLGLTGFSAEELDELLAPIGDGSDLVGDPETVPEPPANPVSRPGDLWVLGPHRLLCGDSTSGADVTRLMHGERAILFATDPPYLVDYDGTNHPGKTKLEESAKNKDWSGTYAITWDDSSQGPELYEGFIRAAIEHAIAPDAAWYCWHASRRQAMVESGLGEVRRVRAPADHLVQGSPHPDPVVLPVEARAVLHGLAQGPQAAAGRRRLPGERLGHQVAVRRGAAGPPDAEAARLLRHSDAPARAAGRAVLRAFQRLGFADHGRRGHRPARLRDGDQPGVRRRGGAALAAGDRQAGGAGG